MTMDWRWTVLVLGGQIACSAAIGEDPELAARLERAEELIAAHCSSAADCGCTVTAAEAGCEPTLTDQWRARLAAGDARSLTYDAECFDGILAGIDEARCGWPPDDDRHPCFDFCQVFHGERAEGESCKRFDDLVSNCEQGLLCDRDRARCVSPCEALSGLAEGEVCRDPINFTELDRCAAGLTCIGETGRCARAPSAGAPCLGGECDADSYCDYDGASEVCRLRVGAGENCEQADCQQSLSCAYVENENGFFAECRPRGQAGEPCYEVGCDEGLGCNYEGAGVCTPLGELGARCDYVDCVEELVCDYTTVTCAEPPAVGLPCIEGECASDSWCDTSLDVATCVADLALVSSCTGHRQCESGFCPAGFCDVRPLIGESCAGSFVCELGASCDGEVCRESATHGPAVCVYDGW